MKITNTKNMNKAIYNAITKDWYSGSGEERDYSVTQLLNPVKLFLLTRRHWDELEDDASERMFMLMGSAIHTIIERANDSDAELLILDKARWFFEQVKDGAIAGTHTELERKFFAALSDSYKDVALADLLAKIEGNQYLFEKRLRYVTKTGKIITGGFDLYDKQARALHDFKFSSVYTWIYRNRPGSRIEEWTQQLNMYRFMAEKAGIPVDSLHINLIMRDFSKSKAKIERSYPEIVETIDIPLLGLDVVESMIESKLAILDQYAILADDNIPACSPLERWQGQDTWAVYKVGNKTASKVEFAYSAAQAWFDNEVQKMVEKEIAKRNADPVSVRERIRRMFYIEKREGTPTRCLDYCPVKQFCNFYKSLPDKVKSG